MCTCVSVLIQIIDQIHKAAHLYRPSPARGDINFIFCVVAAASLRFFPFVFVLFPMDIDQQTTPFIN